MASSDGWEDVVPSTEPQTPIEMMSLKGLPTQDSTSQMEQITAPTDSWDDVADNSEIPSEVEIPKTGQQQLTADEYEAKPFHEKVIDNTLNIVKYNASKYAALANAGVANLNEVVGVDSKLFRENQAFWKDAADNASKDLEPGYGDKEGWKQIVAKEFGNPLNYALVNSLGQIGGVVAGDAAAHQAVGKDAGEGVDMQDVNNVALASTAGMVLGKVIEPTMRILGKQGTKVLDMWRLRGLPDNMKVAIKEGDDEALEQILREIDVSKDMGANDLPFGGTHSKTSNTFEARRAKGELGPVAKTERKAIPTTKKTVWSEEPAEVTADALYNSVNKRAKNLKAPMTEAYNNSVHKASDTVQHDMTEVNHQIMKELQDEGAPDAVVSTVMKRLYSKQHRKLTPDQKVWTRQANALEDNIAQLQKEVDIKPNANTEAIIQSRTNRLNELKSKLPEDTKYFSEKEIINSIRGITYKMDTAGGDIGMNDELAQFWLGKAKSKLVGKAEELFDITGSPILKEFKRANSLAKKYYGYSNSMQEITQLLKGDQAIPEEIMLNLFSNPAKLKTLTKLTKDPKLGKKLAKQMVSQLVRPRTQPVAGALEKLDMKKTGDMLDGVFSDKQTMEFMKKHLDGNQFKDITALRNVTNSFNKMADELPDAAVGMDYIKGADGAVNTAGRLIKTMWDAGGVLKNNVIEGYGGKRGSSRIVADRKAIDRASKLIQKKLQTSAKANGGKFAGIPALTKSEEAIVQKALNSIDDFIGNSLKGTTMRAGGAASQGGTNVQ